MSYDPRYDNKYKFFETGYVLEVDYKNATCTVQRSEGGRLTNVPILNMTGGGGQSTDAVWTKKLRGCHVVLIPVQNVLCVLATVPTTGTISTPIV